MALKDWKKVKENKWRKEYSNKVIFIEYDKLYTNNDYLVFTSNSWNALGKRFKTKSQALRFAKAYMRKH
jgi:hypothetical protein